MVLLFLGRHLLLGLLEDVGVVGGDAWCHGWQVIAVESHRCDRLVRVFAAHRGREDLEFAFLPILHHYVLVEGDLMRCEDLLVPACLLLRVHCRASPMIGRATLTCSVVCWVAFEGAPPRTRLIAQLLKLVFVLQRKTKTDQNIHHQIIHSHLLSSIGLPGDPCVALVAGSWQPMLKSAFRSRFG